jgi:DNA-binding IclR family transcriptional regulator
LRGSIIRRLPLNHTAMGVAWCAGLTFVSALVSSTARLVYDLYGLTAEEIALVEGQE